MYAYVQDSGLKCLCCVLSWTELYINVMQNNVMIKPRNFCINFIIILLITWSIQPWLTLQNKLLKKKTYTTCIIWKCCCKGARNRASLNAHADMSFKMLPCWNPCCICGFSFLYNNSWKSKLFLWVMSCNDVKIRECGRQVEYFPNEMWEAS